MKKVFTGLFMLAAAQVAAQNVGVGTTAPTGRLQINHRSNTGVGLLLLDSNSNTSGSAEFRNINNTRRMLLRGYTESNFNNGQYLDVVSDSSFVATFRGNGRVGIGNAAPLYPLDVAGDINTTGALRINGSAGSSGQVLRSNGNGTMSWDNTGQYSNFVTLSAASGSWTVPAGVTALLVEVWGAGGGGNVLAGGGGGGYIKARFTVNPGDVVSYVNGDGGAGSVSATATSGTSTTCTVGAVTLTAGGGQGALFLTASNGQGGVGGGYSASGTFNNYIGFGGGSGKSQERSYYQVNSTTFYESGKGGRGGDAAGYPESGGAGQTYLYNITGSVLIFRNGNPSSGLVPGGGGASGVQFGTSNISGGNGADGRVTIYY